MLVYDAIVSDRLGIPREELAEIYGDEYRSEISIAYGSEHDEAWDSAITWFDICFNLQ